MLQIISHTPLYVWPLLGYLFWIGWRSKKTRTAPFGPLMILPVAISLWSMLPIVIRHESIELICWMVSESIGIGLGFLTVRTLNLRFDKEKNLIEIAGNWTPLILLMSIFALRYFLGASYGLHPELRGNLTFLGLESLANILSGMFTGRLLGYFLRRNTSPHTDLVKA